jgi:putative mRNA 3-end processing factor
LPETLMVSEIDKALLRRAIVIAPPSASGSPWMKRFGDYSDSFASGWMLLRGARRRRGVDRGFVLSDHADWPGLMSAIKATEAQQVIVTHGSIPTMVRWLCQNGLDAKGFDTEYGDEEEDEALPPSGAAANKAASAAPAEEPEGAPDA